MSLRDEALEMHKRSQGKLEVEPNIKITNKEELNLACSPGVAEPCKDICEDKRRVYDHTIKENIVAIITDGTAVLGLSNIGPEASIPVMEGRTVLFESFVGINGVSTALSTTNTEEIIETIKLLKSNCGGINLEDISAPRCFEIEGRLKKETDIPAFHDDQHGTAVVALTSLVNALRVINKDITRIRVVLNSVGAAGMAIVRLPYACSVRNTVICDSRGAIFEGHSYGMDPTEDVIVRWANKDEVEGSLEEAVKDADVFIGVSMANALSQDMVKSMADNPIMFAMADPSPEIIPDDAKALGAQVVGVGRLDYPNQINDILAFSGIFKGALEVEATHINEEMKKVAVEAITNLIDSSELNEDYRIPGPFDERVAPSIARDVTKAAIESGVARARVDPQDVYGKAMKLTNLQ